jgi:hypothetical protein
MFPSYGNLVSEQNTMRITTLTAAAANAVARAVVKKQMIFVLGSF